MTQVGLGGEGVLRTFDRKPEAVRMIQSALSLGISYFDSARVYSDSELYLGSVWAEKPSVRNNVFQASKSASRDRAGALKDLSESLSRLSTSTLDLWQIHDIRTMEDIHAIEGPSGALEAFVEARDKGTVRHIGVTGHHDPAVLTHAVRNWPVDAVMMPVNPAEGCLGGFLTSTLEAAVEKGIAIIAMKVLGGGHYLRLSADITPSLLIRYALSYDISVAIVGCASPAETAVLADAGKDPVPLARNIRQDLEKRFSPYARKMAFYRGAP